jgi:tetratricopeptide (TPR) repeat protein
MALDPNDYLTSFLYANSLMERHFPKGITNSPVGGDRAAAREKARGLFAHSLALRPDLAEAYAGLGATYAFDPGDLSPGIAALEKAFRFLPSRMDVVFNLVGLYARSGERAKAERLVIGPLSRGGDAKILRAARESLLQADIREAASRLAAGDADGAVEVLQRVAGATSSPVTKTDVLNQVKSIRATQEANRVIAIFNRAAEKVNRSEYGEARLLLRQVVREATDPALRERARKALDQIERALGQAGRSPN